MMEERSLLCRARLETCNQDWKAVKTKNGIVWSSLDRLVAIIKVCRMLLNYYKVILRVIEQLLKNSKSKTDS